MTRAKRPLASIFALALAGLPLAALGTALPLAGPAAAQASFSAAIRVNDRVITGFELQQRARMLEVLSAPGNAQELAREQLIEDRLKLGAADQLGLSASEAEIRAGMEEFAGRANLSTEQFLTALGQQGVQEQTFRDFIRAGVLWRKVVRARFGNRARVTDEELDRAGSTADAANVRVLLSEIILPAPPERADQVRAQAERLSQIRSTAAFSQAAREVSAAQTRGAGGQLPWRRLDELPAGLRPLILGLAPGEVTDPIPIPNAIALFQLRAIEEGAYRAPQVGQVDYAVYYLPGGRSEATVAEARRIAARLDSCDDLYPVAKGQPADRLQRRTAAPSALPGDVAAQLSQLDPGEVSLALTRAQDGALMLLMLCDRAAPGETLSTARDDVPTPGDDGAQSGAQNGGEAAEGSAAAEREARRRALLNQRLQSLADSYLEQLRADATIIAQ